MPITEDELAALLEGESASNEKQGAYTLLYNNAGYGVIDEKARLKGRSQFRHLIQPSAPKPKIVIFADPLFHLRQANFEELEFLQAVTSSNKYRFYVWQKDLKLTAESFSYSDFWRNIPILIKVPSKGEILKSLVA